MGDVADKITYFQAITGLQDANLCAEILQAHGWDLEVAVAVSAFTSTPADSTPASQPPPSSIDDYSYSDHNATTASNAVVRGLNTRLQRDDGGVNGPGLAWKLITLPISVVSASLGLVSGAIGLGIWAAGGILSYYLGVIGIGSSTRNSESSAVLLPPAASEARIFVEAFEREYGSTRPMFLAEPFMDALQSCLIREG